MAMSKVIYPFSGDPITYGHIDIIERAAHSFGEVIAAIGNNPLKQYRFTMEERMEMAEAALAHLPNVQVACYEGLLADFARQQGVQITVRGLRNAEDFNYEWMIYEINESIDAHMETLWLPCRKDKANISSSALKAMLDKGEDISGMTAPTVVEWMKMYKAMVSQ